MAIISGIKIFGTGAKPPVLEPLNATENGVYTPSDGVDGFNPVNVDVQPNLQTKSSSTTITSNGTSTITLQPDSNYDGLSSASVTITTDVAASMPTLVLENGNFNTAFTISGDADLSNWDTSNLTSMRNIFYYCKKLTSVKLSNFDTSNVTDMRQMFEGCSSLTSLDVSNFDTSAVTNMGNTFQGCRDLTSLNVSNFNTSAVTNMGQMFNNCNSLTSLDGIENFDTSAVESMNYMFGQCNSLTSLDLSNWNTSAVTNMYAIFQSCNNLTYLNLSNWNMSNVTAVNDMFYNCSKLTDLNMTNAILPKINLTDWNLDTCKALTVDSLVSVLNALQQLDEGTSYTCTIGSTNLAKLSDTQKAIATNKGWVLN